MLFFGVFGVKAFYDLLWLLVNELKKVFDVTEIWIILLHPHSLIHMWDALES